MVCQNGSMKYIKSNINIKYIISNQKQLEYHNFKFLWVFHKSWYERPPKLKDPASELCLITGSLAIQYGLWLLNHKGNNQKEYTKANDWCGVLWYTYNQ